MSSIKTTLVTNSFKVKDTELTKAVFEKLSFEMFLTEAGQLTGYANEDLLEDNIYIAVTVNDIKVFSDYFDNYDEKENYPQATTWEQFIQEQLLDGEFLVIKATEVESRTDCVLDIWGCVLVITKNKMFRTNLDLEVDKFLKTNKGNSIQ
jgi:hypothetical protein